MIKARLENNKVILIFDTEYQAKSFFEFLKSFREINTEHQECITIRIDLNELEKYRTFLRNKPRNRVENEETIKAYISALKKFHKCANGIVSPETLIQCIKNKHYERALRNYLHMKYYYKEITRYQYIELIERMPRMDKQYGIAQDRIPVSDILISLSKAKRTKYYLIYISLLYSGGVRLRQFIESLRQKPIVVNENIVKIKLRTHGTKTSIYAYLPANLHNELMKTKIKAKPKTIVKTFNELGLTPITMIRSFCWQTAKQILNEELALLLQGRIGELRKRITATSYDDLIFQLDMSYKKWKQFVDKLVNYSTTNRLTAKKNAKKLIEQFNLLMPI